MKGFTEVIITDSQLKFMDDWLEERRKWGRNFVIGKKEVGWWIFKRRKTIYNTETPPEGLYVFSWDSNKYVSSCYPYDQIRNIFNMAQANTKIQLGEELVKVYNQYIKGK